MKCRFAAGVSIYKTSESEVVASGNARTVILEGPAEILLQFLGAFSDGAEHDIESAIDQVAKASSQLDAREIRVGLMDVVDRLLANGIVVGSERSNSAASYKRVIIFLAHHVSSGLACLLSAYPAKHSRLCLVNADSPAVGDLDADGTAKLVAFPGWDRLEELVAPVSDDLLVIAIGLTNAELHKLNKAAVSLHLSWIYAAFSGSRVVVSSIYRHRTTACFACVRLRRLGAVDDLLSGSIVEANLMKDLPRYQTVEAIDRPVDLILAGVMSRKINGSLPDCLHTIDKATLEVAQIEMTKLVDCPVCGGD